MTSPNRRLWIVVLAPLLICTAAAGRHWLRNVACAAHETSEFQESLRDEEARAAALDAESAVVQARIRAKHAIILELLAGRIDLAAAAARFREIHAAHANYLPLLRVVYPDCSDDECMARNVLTQCSTVLQGLPERTAQLARLEDQFAALYPPSYGR